MRKQKMIRPSAQNKIVLFAFVVALVGIFFPMFAGKKTSDSDLIAKPSKSLPGTGAEVTVPSTVEGKE